VRAGVVAVLLVAGCAHADQVALGTAAALTVCDWGGSYRAASGGWDETTEWNPLLGQKPSAGIVTLYFAAVITAEIVAYKLVPGRYRLAALSSTAAVEGDSALGNIETTGVCGL
jgi:hypothetical protein